VCFGHNHGIHLAAGPDLMHLMLEGLCNTLVMCLCESLRQKGVLAEINAILAAQQVRSNDENTKFTHVRAGLESLTRVCAEDMPGVLNSITLALGAYERGNDLTCEDLMRYHRAIYLFGALHRNMKQRDHTEEEVEVSANVTVLNPPNPPATHACTLT
jgi:dsDNA-specific endonuclease/ATPase MutS2